MYNYLQFCNSAIADIEGTGTVTCENNVKRVSTKGIVMYDDFLGTDVYDISHNEAGYAVTEKYYNYKGKKEEEDYGPLAGVMTVMNDEFSLKYEGKTIIYNRAGGEAKLYITFLDNEKYDFYNSVFLYPNGDKMITYGACVYEPKYMYGVK